MNIRSEIEGEILVTLCTVGALEIEGLGSLRVREYPAIKGQHPRTGETVTTPARKVLFFKVAQPLQRHLEGAEVKLSFRNQTLSQQVTKRTGEPMGKVSNELSCWLTETVQHLPKVSKQLWGALGVFEVRRGSGRTMLSFKPSKSLQKSLDGQPCPTSIDSEKVTAILAAYPANGICSAAEAKRLLARHSMKTGRAATLRTQAMARVAGQELPPLLTLFLLHTQEHTWQPLQVPIYDDPEDVEEIISDMSELMWEMELDNVVPFAKEFNGDYWCFCEHANKDKDSYVFLVGPDASSEHQHDLTFGGWLTLNLLSAELNQAAGDDMPLSADDAATIYDYVNNVGPLFSSLDITIPY